MREVRLRLPRGIATAQRIGVCKCETPRRPRRLLLSASERKTGGGAGSARPISAQAGPFRLPTSPRALKVTERA